jgi:ABC-2 type transport system permease protein
MVRYRENVMLLVVFISLPLIFLSGVSWPQSGIPGFWQGVSWIFPSTFGVRAFVRMNSMGATLSDVSLEYSLLWVQTIVYFCLCSAVYRFQVLKSRSDAKNRVEQIGRKEKVRELIQQKQIRS